MFSLHLEIFTPSLNFLIYFVSVSFSALFSLVCFSSYFLCLPLLCSFLHCSLHPPSPKSPLHYSPSLAAGAAAAGIWDTPRVGGKDVSLPPCKRGGGCCVCRSWDNGSCQQDVGVLFKWGNVPWKLGHLAPLHSMSDFSFICCCYECHKHG